MDEAATASRSNKVDERSVEVEVLFVKLAERNAIFVSSAPSSGLALPVVCTASSRAKSVACKNARRCVSLLVEGTSFVVSLIITTDRSAVAFQPTTTTTVSLSVALLHGYFNLRHLKVNQFFCSAAEDKVSLAYAAFSALFPHRRRPQRCLHASRFLGIF